MDCPKCGATNTPQNEVCAFCGAAITPTAERERQLRFERIRNSAEFREKDSPERLMALPKFPAIARVLPFIVAGVFVGMSLMFVVASLCMGAAFIEIGGIWGVLISVISIAFPIGFVAIGVFLFMHFRKKMQEFDSAPVESRPAVIVAKRTEVSGGGSNSSARTTYYLTAEFEDGSRKEFQTMTHEPYQQTAEQDVGILFTRATYLLDFERVRV